LAREECDIASGIRPAGGNSHPTIWRGILDGQVEFDPGHGGIMRIIAFMGPCLAVVGWCLAASLATGSDQAPSASEAIRPLLERAAAVLGVPLVTVMDKRLTPPSGDRHDYFALSPYHWPNPDSPDGRPYVFRDGQVNSAAEGDGYDRVAYFRMVDAITYLAVAYHATKEPRYAQRAAEWLRAWFITPATRMNPNLRFAQCIPGEKEGLPIGLIRGMTIIDVARAERLLIGAEAWTREEGDALRGWVKEYLRWLRDDSLGQREARAQNDHGTWYDAQIASLACYLGDVALARQVVATAATTRIAKQVQPTGRQPFELMRTKSWDYSVMNLEAMVVLADVGRAVDQDLWNFSTPDGRSLRRALECLLPFATGADEWSSKQIKPLERGRSAPVLRRAAIAFPDGPYAAAIKQIGPLDAATILRCRLLDVPLSQ
jgi:Alginate lyase